MTKLYGKEALESLADIYRQIYIDPGAENAGELYEAAVKRGIDPDKKSLSHFISDPRDTHEMVSTPAGEVRVITLHRRADFEMLLIIMGNRCRIKEIPKTQGASNLNGLINWRKIEPHMHEFAEFTKDKNNYLDSLIILSSGPYSNVPAESLRLSDDEWLSLSHTIRLYHECTHFICRKLYPDKKDAIKDELIADAIGLYAAFGKFDIEKECLFLGIDQNGYTGGRLQNYVDPGSDPGSDAYKKQLDDLSKEVYKTLLRIEQIFLSAKNKDPFEMIEALVMDLNE